MTLIRLSCKHVNVLTESVIRGHFYDSVLYNFLDEVLLIMITDMITVYKSHMYMIIS